MMGSTLSSQTSHIKKRSTVPAASTKPSQEVAKASLGSVAPAASNINRPRSNEALRRSSAAKPQQAHKGSRVVSPPPPTFEEIVSQQRNRLADLPASCTSSEAGDHGLGQQQSRLAKYQILKGDHALLGEGGFGIVLKAYDLENGRHVAVKRVLCDRGDLQEEYELLKQIPHPHIVSVYDFVIGSSDGIRYADMFMEWVSEGSLKKMLRAQGRRLYEILIRKFARQTLLALAHLHENGIVHRDVKPDNLLVTSTGTVKLSDMGISAQVLPCNFTTDGILINSEGQTPKAGPAQQLSQAGTLIYMAPECLQNGSSHIGSSADIWAWACTVCEMGSRQLPWSEPGKKFTDQYQLILHIVSAKAPNNHPVIPATLSGALRELLLKCFDPTPAARPTPKELLATPYFSFLEGVDNATGMDTDEEVMERFASEMGMETIDEYDASQAEEELPADY